MTPTTSEQPTIDRMHGGDPIEVGAGKDRIRFNLADGAYVEVHVTGPRTLELRAAGNCVGCLAIRPHGSNLIDVDVIE